MLIHVPDTDALCIKFQDHSGKGTVTNIGSDGWVTVKWDSDGATNTYRMGAEGAYDLMLTT